MNIIQTRTKKKVKDLLKERRHACSRFGLEDQRDETTCLIKEKPKENKSHQFSYLFHIRVCFVGVILSHDMQNSQSSKTVMVVALKESQLCLIKLMHRYHQPFFFT